MLKWPICNISGMTKGIKVKLLVDTAVHIEKNQNAIYANRLSKGHRNNIWGTATSNELNLWGLLLMQLVLINCNFSGSFWICDKLDSWQLSYSCDCDWLRLKPQLLVTTIASACDFDCINYFAVANNKAISQN